MEKKYNQRLRSVPLFSLACVLFFSAELFSAAASESKKEKQEALQEALDKQLFVAAKTLNDQAAAKAIDSGANINCINKENGFTPLLTVSAFCNNERLLVFLLENKADPRISSKNGLTSLMAICVAGSSCGMYKLLAAGSPLGHKDKYGDTVYSLCQDNPEALGLLDFYTGQSATIIKKEQCGAFIQELGTPERPFVEKALLSILGNFWVKEPNGDDLERRQATLAELHLKKR